MNNKNLKPGDIVPCQVCYKNGYETEKNGILIERFRNGWIIEIESGKNKTVKSFSPDGDERLNYRLLGRPE